MPEYLSPGVYVEETSFRSKSIEGVSTSTAGFVGPSRYGPLDLVPEIVTSLGEFERIYGDGQKLDFGGDERHNFLWHAARAFFAEGGRRLYVSRIFRPRSTTDDGIAHATLAAGSPVDDDLTIRARYPGSGGNVRVRLTLRAGQNVRTGSGADARLRGATDRDVVLLWQDASAPLSPGQSPFYVARRSADGVWAFTRDGERGAGEILLTSLTATSDVRLATVSVQVSYGTGADETWDGLALDPSHQRDGAADSLTSRFGFDSDDPSPLRALPIVITAGAALDHGVGIIEALINSNLGLSSALAAAASVTTYVNALADNGALEVTLEGGNDGALPEPGEYEGVENAANARKTGLKQFEDLDDISIVAAPGSSFGTDSDVAATIAGHLVTHAATMRYRIAVLDSMNNQAIGAVRAYRARFDSTYAALYYPWVKVLDPITRAPIALPPSGFVTGIYARNDVERAVYKAPANEVVRLALGFEVTLNKSQQDVLNPEGVNCFRFFEGRGNRLWGARTISSDPEWKYVNLRRYFAYLEHSIDKGTQWAVFEPNGERLWANVRRTIEDFLFNEYQNGALLGDRPERAFFVKCDRSTMTQNDLDNGRLVCLIGVAPLRPAEFVIFRIGQWTGDRKV
ncbi:phage tail sheath subtilisin-like domain-containing protein [Sorangium sp. So ce726]|uniref:phage tail sheath family protein n=1 Tax=Sorangium sp. So ce726 TaxID=3133319 RepID=UPI003F62A218